MSAAEVARVGPFVHSVLGRRDYAIISDIVEPNTRVLDVGCGDGELLEWLAEHKGVDARGVEIVGAKVQRAISRGVSVYQGDIEQGFADYPDQAFDYVILSQTLQETRQPLEGVERDAAGGTARDCGVSEFWPLVCAIGAFVDRARAEDQAVSA